MQTGHAERACQWPVAGFLSRQRGSHVVLDDCFGSGKSDTSLRLDCSAIVIALVVFKQTSVHYAFRSVEASGIPEDCSAYIRKVIFETAIENITINTVPI
mgnify:CR=1 FL=1